MVLEALRTLPPAAPSLITHDRTFAAGELADAVERETQWLRARRVERYALLADNGAAFIIADLALLAAQRLAVPIPACFTAAQIRHALDDAGVCRMLTDDPHRWLTTFRDFEMVGSTPSSRLAVLSCTPRGRSVTAPAGTVKVTYTSGSTGTPKGVCLGAESQLNVARTLAGLSHSLGVRRHLSLLPLPTLLENVAGVYAPLMAGATCIAPALSLLGMSYGSLDADRLLAAIAAYRPDSLLLVPELLKLLVIAVERGFQLPSTLEFVAVGGATVGAELLRRAHAVGLPAHEGYGLTECTSVVSLNLPGAARIGTAGRPLPHAQVRIAGDGEIHVAGASMLGVLGETSASMAEIATGDLGALDPDGFLHVTGRKRNVFVTSFGRNLSPEWIESVLLESAEIRQVLVAGEGRSHPIAVIVPADRRVADAVLERAVDEANAKLPEYAQVREWIRAERPFAFIDGLLTANGRPRRDAILTRYRDAIAALDQPRRRGSASPHTTRSPSSHDLS